MKIDIITLFPEMFTGVLNESILKRAQAKGLMEYNLINLRDYATDKHNTVDDTPCGGGAGMVIKVDVMDRCLEDITQNAKSKNQNQNAKVKTSGHRVPSAKADRDGRIILLTPQGKTFTQKKARELAKLDHIILICGHYEGFDQRIRDHLIDEELSIGDYVLTGGEIPAMVVTDAVSRLVPGVIKTESISDESFADNPEGSLYLEYPQYTKPAEYKDWQVPDVLLSGNHAEINKWREQHKRKKTP